jgi:hypothetical protein
VFFAATNKLNFDGEGFATLLKTFNGGSQGVKRKTKQSNQTSQKVYLTILEVDRARSTRSEKENRK